MNSITQSCLRIACMICIALALSSCITTLTEPLSLSYSEKLVIRGVLQAGKPICDIAITKSLPALSDLSDSATAILDAAGTLSVNGRDYPLRLQSGSIGASNSPSLYAAYSADTVLVAASGSTYTLTVQWQSKTAQAQTSVPPAPVLLSGRLIRQELVSLTSATYIPGTQPVTTTQRDTLLAAEVDVQTLPRIAYRTALDIRDVRGNALTQGYEGGLIFTANDENVSRTIVSGLLPSQTRIFSHTMSVAYTATVYAFDKAYYDYQLTRSRGQQASNLFGGTSGENVVWNVKGDGIGLFIGVATAQRVIVP